MREFFGVRNRKKALRQGFTLTEIAVVLAIIGLILGAIWSAAAQVYANQKNTQAVQEVISVAQGVRTMYENKSYVDNTILTQFVINNGIYPADMLRNKSCNSFVSGGGNESPCPVDPWNAEMSVAGQTTLCPAGGCGTNAFTIILWGMSNAHCAPFLAAVVPQAVNNGLFAIYSDQSGGMNVSSTNLPSTANLANCGGNVVLQFTL